MNPCECTRESRHFLLAAAAAAAGKNLRQPEGGGEGSLALPVAAAAAAAAQESGRQPEGRGDRAAAGKNFIPSVGLNEERKCAAAAEPALARHLQPLGPLAVLALEELGRPVEGEEDLLGVRDIPELGVKVPPPPPTPSEEDSLVRCRWNGPPTEERDRSAAAAAAAALSPSSIARSARG